MIQITQLPESWFKVKLFVDTLSDILLSESETKASQLKVIFHGKVSGDITFLPNRTLLLKLYTRLNFNFDISSTLPLSSSSL